METYTDQHPDTYLTGSLFVMPNSDGGIWGIAVSATYAQYLNAAYAILITGICGFAWQLAVCIALLFYPTEERSRMKDGGREHKDGTRPDLIGPTPSQAEAENHLLEIRKRKANRYVALIGICNATNPWSALMLLCEHAFYMFFKANDQPTAIYDIIVAITALLVGVGTIAAGTIIPSYLVIGTLAPANPMSIFYAIESDLGGGVKVQQTRAPAAQRAMGIVESSRKKLKERVAIDSRKVMDWTGPRGEKIEQTTYNYNITGLDFGLQHRNAESFVVRVQGACTLEYGWYSVLDSDDNFDVYDVFGTVISITKGQNFSPVGGSIYLSVMGSLEDLSNPNRSYAILPDTVSRQSFSRGIDPWYATAAVIPVCPECPAFQVAPRRPALSCWQKDTWSYEEHTAASVTDLASLPGLNLAPVIRNEFIPSRLATPMIQDLAASLGSSILVSSTGNKGGVFDASISSYSADFERLILASYVSSQNILRDTTLIADTYGLVNRARGEDLIPKPGAGGFVINSGDVVTLSLKIMIIIPLIWLLLWAIRGSLAFARSTHRNSGARSRFTLRAVGLQPVQLYRILDEEVCGYRDDWFERRGHMPYIGNARPVHPRVVSLGADQILAGRAPSSGDIQQEVAPVATISVPKHALFAAPKVVIGPDDKHHLKFTGPVRYEPPRRAKSNEGWSWRPHGERGVVADRPDHGERAHSEPNPGELAGEFLATLTR